MRVEGTKQAATRQDGRRDQSFAPQHDEESRALVTTQPTADREPGTIYRQPAFLAHLIAMKEQHPQTRERRRAEPGEAIAAYRAGNALVS
jgi:hypothetical protein